MLCSECVQRNVQPPQTVCFTCQNDRIRRSLGQKIRQRIEQSLGSETAEDLEDYEMAFSQEMPTLSIVIAEYLDLVGLGISSHDRLTIAVLAVADKLDDIHERLGDLIPE